MTEENLDVPPKKPKKTTKKAAVKPVEKKKSAAKKPRAKKIPAEVKPPEVLIIDDKISEDQTMTVIVEDGEPSVTKVLVDALTHRWAYLELRVLNPKLPVFDPPQIILPDLLVDNSELEFVYPIQDHGVMLSTSKGEDFVTSGMSMYKLYLTIEKMICILIDRLKAEGIEDTTQVDVSFAGHELAMRKAFESIVHLRENIVISDFDPGAWGDGYVQRIQNLIDRGLGAPADSPRRFYRKPYPAVLQIRGM